MFSCSSRLPSMVASCGGTTPSDSEYRHEIGSGSAFGCHSRLARWCVTCARVPIGCATRRYSALTSGADWLPARSIDTGLPSVITVRTHSGASWAPCSANMPPRLQPTRLTLRPLLWCR